MEEAKESVPIEDHYEYNDYKIRTKGFGNLKFESMKIPECNNYALILQFKILMTSGYEIQKSITDAPDCKSVLITLGTDEIEITLPNEKDPSTLHVKDPENGFLIVEAF